MKNARFFSIIALLFTLISNAAFASPLALIYKGWGSCNAEEGDAGSSGTGCSEVAADVAAKAGFRVKFVGGDDLPENATPEQVKALFEDARVWIQPGGVAVTAFFSMTRKLRSEIVNFVNAGGGYVGWCAGAFMATGTIGQTRYAGLGIFPGSTLLYSTYTEVPSVDYSFQHLMWEGKARAVYYEGGPYLYGLERTPGTETIALYDTGYVAAARALYGKGRVFISGPHPEAPPIWSEEDQLHDPDGSDQDLAVKMIQWSAGLIP